MNRKTIITLLLCLLFLISCSPRQFLMWYIDIGTDNDLKNSFDGDMALYKNMLICVRDNKMVAFNKDTGEKLWVHRSLNGMDYQRTPVIIENKLFNVTDYDTLVLTVIDLDDPSGKVLYEDYNSNFNGNIGHSVSAFDGEKIYLSLRHSDNHKTLASIDANSYEIESLFDSMGLGARLIYLNDILYIPYDNNNSPPNDKSGIIAYNVVTEEQKWKTSFGTLDGIQCYTPIEYNGKLYVTVDDKTKELDMETGEVLRTFEGQGFYGMSVGDNVLLLPDWLYGYDLNSGKLKWVVEANYSLGSGSVFHNGLFYLMNYGLMVIEAETGNKALSHTFNHSYSEPVWQRDSTSRMPLLDEQAGVIYINGIRGIYAFRTVK